jgi:predicted Zn-dependent protease
MRPIQVAAAVAFAAVACPPAPGQVQPPFVFDKVALNLHRECEALDRQFERRALVYQDAALESRLASLAAPLLPTTPLEHVSWKFRILRHPGATAFALPNGSVYIGTGLIARAENDDQLIGRVAHEIAHVTGRDAYMFHRSLRKKSAATLLVGAGSVFLGGIAAWYMVDMLAGSPGSIGLLAAVAGYPQDIEKAADKTAVDSLKGAGLDPVALLRLSLILEEKMEPEPVPLWNNQPPPRERIAALRALAGVAGDPPPAPDGGYIDRMRPVLLQNLQLDLDGRRFRAALAAAARLVAANPDDPVALFWLGESYRLLGPRPERLSDLELTGARMRAAHRQVTRETEQQEMARLAGTPEGTAALQVHRQKAEALLRKAAERDPRFPDPHFSLGELYEQQGRKADAIATYRSYIGLSRETAAQDRARRRIDALVKPAEAPR